MTLTAIDPALRMTAAGAILGMRGGRDQKVGRMLEAMGGRWGEVHDEWATLALDLADEVLAGAR